MAENVAYTEKGDGLFAAFLAHARVNDTPEGDLIADMRSELRRGADIPGEFRSADHMCSYLVHRGACAEALAAAPGVWRRYRKWLAQRRQWGPPIAVHRWRYPPK